MPAPAECIDPRSHGRVCYKQEQLNTIEYFRGLLLGFQGTDAQREELNQHIGEAKKQFETANPCSVCIAYTRVSNTS